MYVMLGISHLTHLLTILTDYLSLKLPYEIVPPSRGVPHASVRRSAASKPLPLSIPDDPTAASPSKAWYGKKVKEIPNLQTFVEAISLIAWDAAWVLWTQQVWPPSSVSHENEPLEACRLARNLYHLVTSSNIGLNSHASTMDYLPLQEKSGSLPPFTLVVKDIQDIISASLWDEKTGDIEGGGWDMVEGGEEVIRGDGWLKLNSVSHTDG
jgi:Vacuolar sorting 38 and autophagy-related subunit 14